MSSSDESMRASSGSISPVPGLPTAEQLKFTLQAWGKAHSRGHARRASKLDAWVPIGSDMMGDEGQTKRLNDLIQQHFVSDNMLTSYEEHTSVPNDASGVLSVRVYAVPQFGYSAEGEKSDTIDVNVELVWELGRIEDQRLVHRDTYTEDFRFTLDLPKGGGGESTTHFYQGPAGTFYITDAGKQKIKDDEEVFGDLAPGNDDAYFAEVMGEDTQILGGTSLTLANLPMNGEITQRQVNVSGLVAGRDYVETGRSGSASSSTPFTRLTESPDGWRALVRGLDDLHVTD